MTSPALFQLRALVLSNCRKVKLRSRGAWIIGGYWPFPPSERPRTPRERLRARHGRLR